MNGQYHTSPERPLRSDPPGGDTFRRVRCPRRCRRAGGTIRQVFFSCIAAALLLPSLLHAGTPAGGSLRLPPAEAPRKPAPSLTPAQLAAAIDQLHSPRFDVRNQATAQLLAGGTATIPYLVGALTDDSREVRFRAAQLLRHCYRFEDVAPPLMAAARKANRPLACSILRQRAARQVDATTTIASAEKLFAFWGTTVATYRRDMLNRLAEANDGGALAKIVAPLLDLKTKAARFDQITARMDRYALSYKSRYSATYVVAQTLAQGLLHEDAQATAFAEQYMAALETLARELKKQGRSTSVIRKEIADRAVYSQGAAAFLAKTLDPKSPVVTAMTNTLGIAPEQLRHEFFVGLADPDGKACYRRIGKTHITDMLIEILNQWPDRPDGEPIAALLHGLIGTIKTGNKPKALALLDALEGCRDLEKHSLSLRRGLGKQLAQRLAAGALRAANNRAYHPTRAFHNHVILLHDIGVTPRHIAFPEPLVAAYLRGGDGVLTDEQRQALDRYARALSILHQAHVALDGDAARPFVTLMRRHLTSQPELIAAGLTKVMQLTTQSRYRGPKLSAAEVARSLADWAKKQKS